MESSTLLKGVQDALVVTEPDGTVVFMNEAAVYLYGFPDRVETSDGITNLRDHVRDAFDVRTLDGRAVADEDQPVVRTLRGESFADTELLVRRNGDDDARVYVFSGSRIAGDVPLFVLTVRDETDRWRSERRFRVAFETDPAPAIIFRLSDLRILQSNEGMAVLAGLAKDDLEGGLLADLKPLHQSDALSVAIEGLQAGIRIHKLKRRMVSADGTEVHVLISARAIEVDGQACGIMTYADISDLETARRELEASLQRLAMEREHAEVEAARLASVLEQAPILTASLEGPDHVFVTANQNFARLLTARELVGRRVADVMPEIEKQGVIAHLDRVQATGESFVAHEMAIELDTTGGGRLTRRYFDLVFQSLDDGRSTHGVLVQAIDITAQVEARLVAEQLNQNLRAAYDETIEGWARALDLKDEETAGHSQRVTDLTVELSRRMGIAEEELEHIRRGALLHDMGKMGVPDSILLKPGALTADEWAIMKRHTQYAHDFLYPIEHLRPAIDIPYCHHERWDGSGYPRGLAGTAIPIGARIFAAVDVFDALTSARPYRPAWTRDDALAHITAGKGAHFAPDVVDAFLKISAPGWVANAPEPTRAVAAEAGERGD